MLEPAAFLLRFRNTLLSVAALCNCFHAALHPRLAVLLPLLFRTCPVGAEKPGAPVTHILRTDHHQQWQRESGEHTVSESRLNTVTAAAMLFLLHAV
jgi:hypothetical protein